MIGYVMVGTTDLQRATDFYDDLLKIVGLVRDVASDSYAAYSPQETPQTPQFYVTYPHNGLAATAGNGTMISMLATSRKQVDEFHAMGIAQGGIDEGKPGERVEGSTAYFAYIRDLDGNKICAFCE